MAKSKAQNVDQDICVTLDRLLEICKNGRDVMNSKGDVVNVTATHQDFNMLMKWGERRANMRKDAGLLLPERQIGLSAHDFQQAIAAPRVILTRATRDAEAQTVPSRWLNRLLNLMEGLPDRNGKVALAAMRARGAFLTLRP